MDSAQIERLLSAFMMVGKAKLEPTNILDALWLLDRTAVSYFFQGFCNFITKSLELDQKAEDYWHAKLSPTQNCTHFMEVYIFKHITQPIMLAMDEIEYLLSKEYSSEFFSMLRMWHNNRLYSLQWQKLDLVLAISTEPYQLIDNPFVSPFNVGNIFNVGDFTYMELHRLNELYDNCMSEAEETKLYNLLGGHPFLSHQALSLVANKQLTASELFDRATDKNGPFSDHLNNLLSWLTNRYQLHLADAMRQVLGEYKCDPSSFFQLESNGLIRSEGKLVYVRCKLYEDYFRAHL